MKDLDLNLRYDFKSCTLCPRACGADRRTDPETSKGALWTKQETDRDPDRDVAQEADREANCEAGREPGPEVGKRQRRIGGYCGMPMTVMAARAALHRWEEPFLSDSGAVFFSGCTLRCVYCQNYEISTDLKGKPVSIPRLADIFLELEDQGAKNINLVTPTHFVPQIISALDLSRAHGLDLPIVYNTSGYERVETLRMLEGYVDIWLPDFKYMDSRLSFKYSGASDYFEVAAQALAEMVRQTPEAVFAEDDRGERQGPGFSKGDRTCLPDGFNEDGGSRRMLKGVIVRHLLLPGCLMDAKRIVRYLYETYEDRIWLSLLNQYTPMNTLDREKYPELDQKVRKKSYDKLVRFALDLGVRQAFIQESEAAKESFIPGFDGTGI